MGIQVREQTPARSTVIPPREQTSLMRERASIADTEMELQRQLL